MRNYSKTPWTVGASGVNKTIIRADHGGAVATLEAGYQAMREADAAFIVRACNAHDDLVAALENLLDKAGNFEAGGMKFKHYFGETVFNAHAALAKAKGEA